MSHFTRGREGAGDVKSGAMLDSRDPHPAPEVRAAWSREIERRVREVDEQAVELIDWEAVRAELFAED